MPVIPFNPGGDATRRRHGPCARTARGRTGAAEPPEAASGEAASGEGASSKTGDHARAARLEQALIAALRESAANWARAERAERAERTFGARDPAHPAGRG